MNLIIIKIVGVFCFHFSVFCAATRLLSMSHHKESKVDCRCWWWSLINFHTVPKLHFVTYSRLSYFYFNWCFWGDLVSNQLAWFSRWGERNSTFVMVKMKANWLMSITDTWNKPLLLCWFIYSLDNVLEYCLLRELALLPHKEKLKNTHEIALGENKKS